MFALGYKNAFIGATLTHSTEATSGDFDAENIQHVQLHEPFRSTVVAPAYVNGALGQSVTVGLLAVIASNVSAYRQLLPYAKFIGAGWGSVGLDSTSDASAVPINSDDIETGEQMIDNLSGGEHYMIDTIDLPSGPINGGLLFWVCVQDVGDLSKFRLYVNGTNTGTVTADFDSSNGQLIASSGSALDDTHSERIVHEAIQQATYLCAMSLTPDPFDTSLTVRIGMLDAGGNPSYTGANNTSPSFGAIQIEHLVDTSDASQRSDYYRTEDGVQGAWWGGSSSGTLDFDYEALARQGDMTGHASLYQWKLFTPLVQASAIRVDIDDQDRPGGYLDIEYVYAGPVFKPRRNVLTSYSVTPGVSRIFNVTLGYVDEDQAIGDMQQLGRDLDIGPSDQQQVMMRRQKIRPWQKGAFMIVDDDSAANSVELAVYGYINSISTDFQERLSESGEPQPLYTINIVMEEIVA